MDEILADFDRCGAQCEYNQLYNSESDLNANSHNYSTHYLDNASYIVPTSNKAETFLFVHFLSTFFIHSFSSYDSSRRKRNVGTTPPHQPQTINTPPVIIMATKVSGTHAAAVADSQGEGEYNLHYNDKSTGQEWILDAYRSLEPGVRFII